MFKVFTKKRVYRRNTRGGGNCFSSGTCRNNSEANTIHLTPGEKLLDAIEKNDLDKAKEAINEGANINGDGTDYYSRLRRPLLAAIKTNNLDMVKFILSQKNIDVDIHFSEMPSFTRESIQDILIRHGANPDIVRNTNVTRDIQTEQNMVTDVIVKKGLPSGFTELTRSFLVKPYGDAAKKVFNAIKTNRLLGVQNIIETEIQNLSNKQLVDFFYPANVNSNTFLMSAARVDNAPIVKYLLDLVNKGLIPNHYGVNYVNIINEEDNVQSALHIAIDKNHMDIVNMLLDNPSIDINIADSDGFTPVIYAINNNKLELVKKLVDKGAVLYLSRKADYFPLALAQSLSPRVNDDVFKYMLTLSPEKLGRTYDNFMEHVTWMLSAYVSDKDISQPKLKILQQYIADHSRTGGKSRSKRRRRTLRKKGKKLTRKITRRARK